MGGLALLLLEQRHKVSGSDIQENYVTLKLKKEGADIALGHDPKNVLGADIVVFSSAIPLDNPELIEAKKKNMIIKRRAELLAELMDHYIGITVAGAHGKTTTTSMIAALLNKAGLNPAVAIGGIVQNTLAHAHLGMGKYFVAEVDESDGSFLNFSPHYSVITNIDFEHVDYYQNWQNILKAYEHFIDRTAPGGLIVAWGEDERLRGLLKNSRQRFLTYGFSDTTDITAKNLQFTPQASFDCVVKGQEKGRVILSIPGEHNILNALACVGIGLNLSIDFSLIQESLHEFQGVKRRLQWKGEVDGISVLDDYAHHPTEIDFALKTAQALKKTRLILVFQPHRYSRVKYLKEAFERSLGNCDYLILTDIYAASEKPLDEMTTALFCETIREKTTHPVVYLPLNRIGDHLLKILKPGDLLLTMGAGDITSVSDQLIEGLKNHPMKIACHC